MARAPSLIRRRYHDRAEMGRWNYQSARDPTFSPRYAGEREWVNLLLLQPDVLELHPHRLPRVQLQGEDAFAQRQLRLLVGEVDGLDAIDEVLDVVALGDDDVLVPAVDLEGGADRLGVADGADDVLLPVLPDGLFADEAHAAALAAFVVDEAGGFRVDADLRLIAADDPVVLHVPVLDVLRAILDARVVRRAGAERKPQLEIFDGAALPDDEGVALGRVLRRGLPADDAVLHGPQPRVAVP